MTSRGNSFNDLPENQLTYQISCNLKSTEVNRDHAFLCSKQNFSRYFHKISQVIQLYTITAIGLLQLSYKCSMLPDRKISCLSQIRTILWYSSI